MRWPDVNSRINLDGVGGLETARAGYSVRHAWIKHLPVRLWARLLRAYRARRARASLEALDDRILRDIGVSRHEMEQLASDGAAREQRRLQALASCRQQPGREGTATHRGKAPPESRSGNTTNAGPAAGPIDLADIRLRSSAHGQRRRRGGSGEWEADMYSERAPDYTR